MDDEGDGSRALPAPPGLGERAPDFTLPDSTGRERSLGALVRDRRQVLIFYRGHW